MDAAEVGNATAEIFERKGVLFAYLFGSQARGDARPDSDIDLAVMPAGEMMLFERGGLITDLCDRLGTSHVDVLFLDEADLELRGKVVQEGVRLYCTDEVARLRFEVDTRSEYFDFLPILESTTRGYLKRVANRGFDG